MVASASSADGDVRGEAALVADGRVQALVVQHLLEAVEDLRPHPQPFAEGRRPDGHDHELLEVDGVVRVLAAVEDVHQRHGQHAWRSCRRGSGRAAGPAAFAAAWATASDTPRIAFAPSLPLFGVPSSSSIFVSMRDLVEDAHAR